MPQTYDSRWDVEFPDPETARPNGLVAYGGNLEPQTLLSAYAQGIFPWYSEAEPILWWSPDPRCVIFPRDFHISQRSARKIRNSGFFYSFDRNFAAVLAGCAMPRNDDPETWLIPEMQEAYERLFIMGYAHSVEIWQDGTLAGGLYGVSVGSVFFGESMFHLVSEASRAALLCLNSLLTHINIFFMDCQLPTPHMLAMGAINVPRRLFLRMLERGLRSPLSWQASWRDLPHEIGPVCGVEPAEFS